MKKDILKIMNIIFWNTHRNADINKYVIELALDYSADVLILAEYNGCKVELDKSLKQTKMGLEPLENFVCKRIVIYTNYLDIDIGPETAYSTSFIINKKIIVSAVHLFTDLYGNAEDERLEVISNIREDIEKLAKRLETNSIIFAGDFNGMPYSKECLAANGLHGIPVYSKSETNYRTIKNKEYKKYYNPMWNLMGDISSPPGTYYSKKAMLLNPLWFMFDQFIVSWELAELLDKKHLKIVSNVGEYDLQDKDGHPNEVISDHFPISCRIREEDFYEQ